MKKFQIIIILITFIILGIVISTVYNADTYTNFSTVIKNKGNNYQVIGKLNKNQPIEYSNKNDSLLLSFYLIDKNNMEQKVLFFGAKPMDFEKSEEIIIVCSYNAPNIIASKLMMKCPSKYKQTDKDFEEYISNKNTLKPF